RTRPDPARSPVAVPATAALVAAELKTSLDPALPGANFAAILDTQPGRRPTPPQTSGGPGEVMEISELEKWAAEPANLEVDALLEEARRQTGLSDFGSDQSFRVGLDELVRAIEEIDPSPYLRADA